jgi:hypothetical protein
MFAYVYGIVCIVTAALVGRPVGLRVRRLAGRRGLARCARTARPALLQITTIFTARARQSPTLRVASMSLHRVQARASYRQCLLFKHDNIF